LAEIWLRRLPKRFRFETPTYILRAPESGRAKRSQHRKLGSSRCGCPPSHSCSHTHTHTHTHLPLLLLSPSKASTSRRRHLLASSSLLTARPRGSPTGRSSSPRQPLPKSAVATPLSLSSGAEIRRAPTRTGSVFFSLVSNNPSFAWVVLLLPELVCSQSDRVLRCSRSVWLVGGYCGAAAR
jgi:hypothetical protein